MICLKFITNIQEGRKINKDLVKMILDNFRGREKVEPHTEVPQGPKFLERLGLRLNFEFLHELFSLLAEFKARFPKLNVGLNELVEIVKKNNYFF